MDDLFAIPTGEAFSDAAAGRPSTDGWDAYASQVESDRIRDQDARDDEAARNERRRASKREEYGHRTGEKRKEQARKAATGAPSSSGGLPWWALPAGLAVLVGVLVLR